MPIVWIALPTLPTVVTPPRQPMRFSTLPSSVSESEPTEALAMPTSPRKVASPSTMPAISLLSILCSEEERL